MQASFLNTIDSNSSAATNITFSSSLSSTPLYDVNEQTNFFSYNLNEPLSYQGLLEPGQTYTLSVDSQSTDLIYGTAMYQDQGAGSFSFTATVPEPTALVLLPLFAPMLLRRSRK